MSRWITVVWHVGTLAVAGVLYFFFTLPRWSELADDGRLGAPPGGQPGVAFIERWVLIGHTDTNTDVVRDRPNRAACIDSQMRGVAPVPRVGGRDAEPNPGLAGPPTGRETEYEPAAKERPAGTSLRSRRRLCVVVRSASVCEAQRRIDR